MVHLLSFMDVWTATAERKTFTHYAPQSAARLDKYVSQIILKKIRGGECNGGIYRPLYSVSQDKPWGYKGTFWTKAL